MKITLPAGCLRAALMFAAPHGTSVSTMETVSFTTTGWVFATDGKALLRIDLAAIRAHLAIPDPEIAFDDVPEVVAFDRASLDALLGFTTDPRMAPPQHPIRNRDAISITESATGRICASWRPEARGASGELESKLAALHRPMKLPSNIIPDPSPIEPFAIDAQSLQRLAAVQRAVPYLTDFYPRLVAGGERQPTRWDFGRAVLATAVIMPMSEAA